MKLLAVACLAAAAVADECSHTQCSFVDINVPSSIQSAFSHNFGATTKIMKITHNNDENKCHTATQTQNSDGTWARTHDCTGAHCYKGVHCGLTDKDDWNSCKCFKEDDVADKTGDMAHRVATQFPQSTSGQKAHDIALASNVDGFTTEISGGSTAAPHDPVPHFNGNTGAHTGGSTEHNPAPHSN